MPRRRSRRCRRGAVWRTGGRRWGGGWGMANDRPPIPTTMKRTIRRRAGYGCVLCGCPFYEYHHINGFDPSLGHKVDEITLLCDKCHRKEQNGLIPREKVVQADKTPINI